jgi:hypothetical protein
MGQAATTASRAYAILSDLASGTATRADLGFDPASLANANMDDVVVAIVDAVCRDDVTGDDAGGKRAVAQALSEVLELHPDADPLAMSEPLIRDVWIRTLSYHCFGNIMLDLGKALQNGAGGDAALFNDRCVEIRSFVLESFREQLEIIEQRGVRPTKANCAALAKAVTRQVMEAYSGWMQ